MTIAAFVLGLLAGGAVALQTGSNAKLKEIAGAALPAIIVSSSLGVALLVAAMVVGRQPWPSLAKLADAPLSAWLGGAFGAAYAIVTVMLARHLGAATLVALVVTGQLVCSVVLDHYGIIGFDMRPATAWRLIGCALMLAGLVLIWKL